MAQLPSALACHLSSVASSELPLAWTAKSMIVVVPPQAAARVPVSKVSTENVPPNGISMWVWAAIPPGSTDLPGASMPRSAAPGGGRVGGRPAAPLAESGGQRGRDLLPGHQHARGLVSLGGHHGAA